MRLCGMASTRFNRAMKKLICLLLGFATTVMPLPAQDSKSATPKKLTPAEAKESVGKYGTVVAKVVQVRAQEKMTHINFEKPYPYHTFTAIVFASRTNLFPDLEKLVSKTVEVSGKIEEYNGKPQMILLTKNQLKVIEEKPGKAEPNSSGSGAKPKAEK